MEDKENNTRCEECGAEFDFTVEGLEYDGAYFCRECVEIIFNQCYHCGSYHHPAAPDHRHINDCYFCDDCVSELFVRCEDCLEFYLRDETCFRRGAYYCEDCASEVTSERIESYSYSPRFEFKTGQADTANNNLFFGVELEIEVANDIDDACDIVEEAGLPFYMKEDGSIDHGFEIVSHPCTLNFWLENKDSVSEMLTRLAEDECRAESQGMHVHMSKAGMSDIHKIRFQSFFDMLGSDLEKIARRSSQRWAKTKELAHRRWKTTCDHGDRYVAVNWLPDRTVEVRCFRGTLSPATFFASIEFCHAVYQFTKDQISLAQIAGHRKAVKTAFEAFVYRGKRYSELKKYLSAINFN